MTKNKKMNMHKLFCLLQLTQECLDELEVEKPRMIKLKNDISELCDLMNESVKDTYTIQKSTYFHEISHKIDTIMRKNFNEEM